MRFSHDLESRRYLLLATAFAIVVLALGFLTVDGGVVRWHPGADPRSAGVTYLGRSDFSTTSVQSVWFWISVPLSAAGPLIALRRPRLAVLAALALPVVTLVLGAALFSAFAGALATAAILLRRSLALGVGTAVASLALPAVITWEGTLTMFDSGTVYAFGRGTGWRLATWSGFAAAAALVVAAALAFRTWTRHMEARAQISAERLEVGNVAAVLGERSRLARDLHDVVAHHVSLIAVRAETAPYTVEDLSPGARVVLADIADDSRKALDELRGVLGILRRSDPEGPERAPQPGVDDVADLLARARRTGAVSITGEAALAALDAPGGYVAYRVVQEALTNARRHAPGSPVAIDVAAVPDGVRLRVANPAGAQAPLVPGRGLTGMRERVEAVGGALVVEHRGGDVVVEAVLPA